MVRVAPSEYRPDIAIAPGETITEVLEDLGMSQTELAERMGRPLNKVNEVVNGKRAITPETAQELELVLGLPAPFWMNLEANYQLARKRLAGEQRLVEESEALKLFPLKEMIKLGWLEKGASQLEQTRNLLKFFRITSFASLTKPCVMGAAFRKSPTKEACHYALAAWLRRGEIEAERIEAESFDRPGLIDSIVRLRSLSLLDPQQFEPELVGACASHGVAVVFVPHLPKCDASGAAYWIGDKAIIQLSLRFRFNDHFWFSFFHELGHIVQHGRTGTFVDDFKASEDVKEREADEFASRCLIPPRDFGRLMAMSYRREDVVKAFAAEIGIAPGIVVGRLQHDRLLPCDSGLNALKVRFIWAHEKRAGR
jgi:addiction module HigA family antidote